MPNFKIVRKGYDPAEVDSFINNLNDELSAYKEKENYINRAIINAEMSASELKAKTEAERNEIISSAKVQADQFLMEVKTESERLLSKTQNQVALIRQREKDKMDELKQFMDDKIKHVSSFYEDYQALVKKYFEIPHTEEFEKLNDSLQNIVGLIDGFQNSDQNDNAK